MKARKFYIRHREGYPETEMQDSARRGFLTLGVEVAPYTWIDDVDDLPDLGPEVGVSGYVGDVLRALDKVGRPRPEPVDYPEALRYLLGRDVRQGVLDDVTRSAKLIFVKPVRHKLFTGFVWKGDADSRMRVASVSEDEPVWISDVVDMRSEHRVFVLRGEIVGAEIVGACRYKGDWWLAPDKDVVEGAVRELGAPIASYCLDFAVTGDGRTILVEMNEGFAFGHVGLRHAIYAEMLAERWYEIAGGA